MVADIFDKILDVYFTIRDCRWHKSLGQEPEEFSSADAIEKSPICCEIMLKLESLLEHMSETLTSWALFDRHLHKSFDEWLQFKMNEIEIPSPLYYYEKHKISDKWKALIKGVIK